MGQGDEAARTCASTSVLVPVQHILSWPFCVPAQSRYHVPLSKLGVEPKDPWGELTAWLLM